MRFVHIADMHFDMPFRFIDEKLDLGIKRRLEQREVFKDVITYIQKNEIEFLFISGDLYEHEYVRQSTIEYINNLFHEIPNTKIYITPGNHDPYLKNSYYDKYMWSENVKIFTSDLEIVENDQINIYGCGFNDFYKKDSQIEEIVISEPNKINILITHGSLDGGSDDNREYHPMSRSSLKRLGFDYIALGHIHKSDYDTNIVYPGSTIALGFDELGEHGMIVGEITKQGLKTEFIALDKREFKEISMDISEIYSLEEIVEKINDLKLINEDIYKVIFTGKRKFEIDIAKITKLIENENIVKIKDQTKLDIDIDELENQSTLKGYFIKEVKSAYNKEEINEDIMQHVIEIGLDILSS